MHPVHPPPAYAPEFQLQDSTDANGNNLLNLTFFY